MRSPGQPSSFVERVDRVDRTVDEAWDVLRGRPALDRLFYTASELGDYSLLWHLLGTAKGLGPAGPATSVRLSGALGIESALVNGLIKSLFRRQRPVVDVPRPRRLRTPRTTSFPSGHASSAALAATLLAERSRLAPLYVAVAVVVATSRIHVRIHHASDVVAGAALGIALGRLTRRLVPLDR